MYTTGRAAKAMPA